MLSCTVFKPYDLTTAKRTVSTLHTISEIVYYFVFCLPYVNWNSYPPDLDSSVWVTS